MALLNDTVGTLMACAFKENNCEIGVIVGTGTNACYMEKLDRCEKLEGVVDKNEKPDQVGESLVNEFLYLLPGLRKI